MSNTYAADTPQWPFTRYDTSVWKPPMFVLPRFWRCRTVPAALVVTLAIGSCDAVVEDRSADGHAIGRRNADARLDAGQPLGPEVLVGEGQDGAHPELAIELVQRRRAEAAADAAPHADAIARAIQAPRRAG